MTTELTLREKVLGGMTQLIEDGFGVEVVLGFIASHLEATAAPAYCRVADDLRGVVREEGTCDEPGCGKDSTEMDLDTNRETCADHHEPFKGLFDDRADKKGDLQWHVQDFGTVTIPDVYDALGPAVLKEDGE